MEISTTILHFLQACSQPAPSEQIAIHRRIRTGIWLRSLNLAPLAELFLESASDDDDADEDEDANVPYNTVLTAYVIPVFSQ